jgi:ribose-phosphate pyrophosphokinase
MIDALKRASAGSIVAVMPYFGYARQDRKVKPRTPISAKLVANLLTTAGADRVLTVDLHAGQIQGFFDIPVDHLYAMPVMIDHLKNHHLGKDTVIVSPDAGGVERARAIAKRMDVGLAIVDKRRTAPNEADVMFVIGDVEGCNALIVDDIVDTAGTLTKTVEALKAKGAKRVLAAGVHGVLSGPALQRIAQSPVEAVLITNTTPLDEKLSRSQKLRPLTVSALLGEAIRRIHENSSVSSLFV